MPKPLSPSAAVSPVGKQIQSHLTSTTEEDFGAAISTDASYGLDQLTTHYFVSFVSTATSYSYSLTPNTVSTFKMTAPGGSSLFGILTSLSGGFVSAQEQDYSGTLQITGGMGEFQGATGAFADQGVANSTDSADRASVTGTITVPAAVPEASTTVSLGLLLALGLSGMAVTARKKKNA